MKIQVFGTGCASCEALYNKVLYITRHLDLGLDVDYISDVSKIVELGVMTSPVLVIENDIISSGYIPHEQEVKDAILRHIDS